LDQSQGSSRSGARSAAVRRPSPFGRTAASWLAAVRGLSGPADLLDRVRQRAEWLRFARAVSPSNDTQVSWLGSSYGGYAVPTGLVGSDWVCYCAGLGEDVSFELELIRESGCTVYAFDPTPLSIAHCARVAKDEPKFRFYPLALWREDSKQRFYAPKNPNHVSHSLANLQETDHFIEVECRSVSSLMEELGHDRIDLLKLDVEGAEYSVLEDVLGSGLRPRVLCIDFHRVAGFDELCTAVDDVRAHGYMPVHVYRTDVTFVGR
jgi:FkbM family methyltransferase